MRFPPSSGAASAVLVPLFLFFVPVGDASIVDTGGVACLSGSPSYCYIGNTGVGVRSIDGSSAASSDTRDFIGMRLLHKMGTECDAPWSSRLTRKA